MTTQAPLRCWRCGQPIGDRDYPANYLKHDLDLFCQGLWDAALGEHYPRPVAGIPDAPPVRCVVESLVVEGGGDA